MPLNNIIRKNAILIFIGIVAFFFTMKALGFETVTELRALNFIIVFLGLNKAIKTNIIENHETHYFNNLAVGIATAAFAVLLTVAALVVYIDFIDSSFLVILENSFLWGQNLSLPLIVFALLIEGIASSVICSFILMQYYKNFKLKEIKIKTPKQ